MAYLTLRPRLPRRLAARLFGDRERWGRAADLNDPMWQEWETRYLDFYTATQQRSVGNWVSRGGYSILSELDLGGARVLEFGPGHIRHLRYWNAKPREYVIADIQIQMLDRSSEILAEKGISFSRVLLPRNATALPFPDNAFDVVISFYALEHVHPLKPLLRELSRVLKPGGALAGAIPTEGGLGWGLGRFLTTRRWLRTNTGIDPDKIICWEHPNFADRLLADLDREFARQKIRFWPLRLPLIDLNLVVKFVYRKNRA